MPQALGHRGRRKDNEDTTTLALPRRQPRSKGTKCILASSPLLTSPCLGFPPCSPLPDSVPRSSVRFGLPACYSPPPSPPPAPQMVTTCVFRTQLLLQTDHDALSSRCIQNSGLRTGSRTYTVYRGPRRHRRTCPPTQGRLEPALKEMHTKGTGFHPSHAPHLPTLHGKVLHSFPCSLREICPKGTIPGD